MSKKFQDRYTYIQGKFWGQRIFLTEALFIIGRNDVALTKHPVYGYEITHVSSGCAIKPTASQTIRTLNQGKKVLEVFCQIYPELPNDRAIDVLVPKIYELRDEWNKIVK